MTSVQWRGRTIVLLLALAARPALAQTPPASSTPAVTVGAARPISLAEAIRIAEEQSEEIGIARSSVTRARGETIRARSQYFPQVNGSARYSRTLSSEFEGLGGSAPAPDPTAPPIPEGPCDQYILDPSATELERLAGLEAASRCATGGGAFAGLGDLPFGQKNQYNLGLDVSQQVYSGGRVGALNSIASAGRRSAEIELTAARAQLRLSVTEAYFDAALSDRLMQIAESALVQTENVFRQTKLSRQVGDKSEFDLLRAQVTRDNQRPVVIQRRTQRDLAYLRLKQLLNLPYQQSLQLATDIGDATLEVAVTDLPTPDTSATARASVRQANEAVEVQEGLLRIQKAQRMPSVALTSQLGRVAYPGAGLPGWGDFRQNWSVGVGLSLPIFTGWRIRGDELVAKANVDEARLRLRQTTELAALDAQSTLAALAEAEAAWQASAGTAEQASRAYTIAEVRYREGISTQVELSESRILLQQAQANRALAARDLQVARVRLALLRDLPLDGSQQQQAAVRAQQQQQQQQLQQQQQQQTAPRQSAGGSPTSGGIVP
jgi:outer membrane protein